jgi:hypothetical protein
VSNPFTGVRPVIAALFLSVLAIALGGFIYDTARQTGQIEGQRERVRSEVGAEGKALARCKAKGDGPACIVEAKEKQLEIRREEDAVLWQREAARSAWWAVAFSLLQGLVGLGGLIALLRSLRQTDRALFLSEAANSEARKAEQLSLRAYLDFDTVEFGRDTAKTKQAAHWLGLHMTFRNFGQTPAADLNYETTFAVVTAAGGIEIMSGREARDGLAGVSPGDTFTARTYQQFDQYAAAKLDSGEWHFVATIAAKYRDQFGGEHRLESVYTAMEGLGQMTFQPGSRIAT